jgi:peptidoglycan/xylan/chitin deacetylase (PgdA/CDA1 family)
MKQVPVLNFHKISDRFEWGVTSYSPAKFAILIEKLVQSGYEFCLPETAGAKLKPIILTFDDAYESVYLNALPILKKHRLPFIVLVISDYIGRKNLWDANLGGKYFAHMDAAQLLEIVRHNGYLGSHSVTHRAFSNLTENQVMDELKNSKKAIQYLSGSAPRIFATPFGEHKFSALVSKFYQWQFINGEKTWDGSTPIIPRFNIYRYESPALVLRKIEKQTFTRFVARSVQSGAKMTALWQKLRRRDVYNSAN